MEGYENIANIANIAKDTKVTTTKIDTVTVVTADPNPCEATGCSMQGDPVETCRDHRCPHRWTREAAEDRQRREAKDAKGKEERVRGDA